MQHAVHFIQRVVIDLSDLEVHDRAPIGLISRIELPLLGDRLSETTGQGSPALLRKYT